MKRRLLLIPLAALSLGFGWPGADPEPVGEAGVRMLWFGEHVGLLTANLQAAGWTPEEMTLQVWGDSGEALPGMPTLLPPSSWAEVGNVQERTIRLDMWANLPDVTWSIADWSMGNERCPWSELGHDVTPESCNTFFLGWLSAANSTHFPPQSHASWSWHHQLALDVAARCVTLDQALDGLGYLSGPYADWLDGFREECEALAIAFEGVGHHYLQDAWSSGHMWERWGSPDVGDWQGTSIATAELLSPLYAGVLVGGLAGLVHGSESILGDPDPMCSEHPDVYYVPGDGVGIEGGPALGDYNVNGLIDAQRARLVACGQGSLDEVLAALPGALGLSSTGAAPVTQQACFDQRVTNRAWQVGLMEAYGYLNYGISSTISWLGRLALLSDGIGDPLGTYAELSTGVQMRSEMARIGIIADAAEWAPQIDPLGTDFANGELPMVDGTVEPITFLGMTRNREWVAALQSDFASFDPPAAVIAGEQQGANSKKQQDADALRRTFHRAYADTWCGEIDPDADDEQSDLRRLQASCQSPDDGFGSKEAACTACEELALRFHRDGEDSEDYDTTAEPLCSAFGATDYFYLPTGGDIGRFAGVSGWCRGGGGWSVSDEFVWTFDPSRPAEAFGDGANIVASLPSGVSALSLATTSDKAFFAGSDGNLYQVGQFGDVTAFSGLGCVGPRGVAVDPEAGRLFVACHDSHSVASFTLFNSPPTLVDVLDLQGGIPGTIVEEPRDVAVHPFGYEIAVASYETYGQRDGVTLIELDTGGTFGDANHVEIDADFTISQGQTTIYPGLYFGNSVGVDYSANGFDVYVSNFSNLECLGGGFMTCDQPFGGSYWVSVVDDLLGTIDANELVAGRTTDVLRLWDDKVAVVSLTPVSQVYVFDGTASSQPVATIDVGYERPNHLTADRDGRSIFVGFDAAGTTCGLGVIDASDPDPALWSFERLDPSVGCARFVHVPE